MVGDDTAQGTCNLLRAYLEKSNDEVQAMRHGARQCFEKHFEIDQAALTLQALLKSFTGAN